MNRISGPAAIALGLWLAACAAASSGDAPDNRGAVYLESTEIILRESYPVQAALILRGSLPTPCHELVAEASPPDEQDRIRVEVYSRADPETACIQVLQAFEETVELGSYRAGNFSVWVNGEPVGEIDL